MARRKRRVFMHPAPIVEKNMRELSAILLEQKQTAQLNDFLRALLTPSERSRLAMRWRLCCLLASGVRQRDIAEQMNLSLCNITRGSRVMKQGPACFRESVDRHLQRTGQRVKRRA